jgi:hypothetical protein
MNHKTLARSDEQGEDPEGVGEAPPLQRDATFLQHALEKKTPPALWPAAFSPISRR